MKYDEVGPGNDCSILYVTTPKHASTERTPAHGHTRRGQFQKPRMEYDHISHARLAASGTEPA